MPVGETLRHQLRATSVLTRKNSAADDEVEQVLDPPALTDEWRRPALPSFPGGALPSLEPAARTVWIRTVALLAIGTTALYLLWRALGTIDPMVWWVAIPFFALEVHALLSLVLFTFSLWDVNSQRPARPVEATDARIAVFIPTYNEDLAILLPTIAAAVALRPAHETWVLDDGQRPEVERLAAQLGARYVARPERTHAKAGNINHALKLVDADFIVILDADHVARPDLLRHTLGYFDDPRVALVQTPQEFYNLDSFEHEEDDSQRARSERHERYHEQALFYRLIQPGKNRWQGAFWCGTCAVVRVAALREVGGVATETITEDIHTTIRLHRRGWKTVYHNEVLARGLAASTAAQFQLQRYRWGTGAMQVLRVENPLVVPGLRLQQRLAYAATLLGWFEAWRSLGYLLAPPIVLLTGAVPIRAEPLTFLLAFGSTFLLQRAALRLLSRDYARTFLPTVFELVRMTPNLLATLTLVLPRRPRFVVTPKGRLGQERRRLGAPTLLTALAALGGLAALWFTLTIAGQTPLRYEQPWAAYGALFWLVINTVLMVMAIFRIRSVRFGLERRASVRFTTALPGTIDSLPCVVQDLSLTGALVGVAGAEPDAGAVGREQLLTIHLGTQALRLRAIVRSRRASPAGGTHYGLEFVAGQQPAQARLALALFNARLESELTDTRVPAA